jgi:hypothetical protein
MKGLQFAGSTYPAPTTMKNRMAASLIVTITALARALSRTPMTSSDVITRTIRIAGRLMSAPSTPVAGAAVIHTGKCIPNPARIRWK